MIPPLSSTVKGLYVLLLLTSCVTRLDCEAASSPGTRDVRGVHKHVSQLVEGADLPTLVSKIWERQLNSTLTFTQDHPARIQGLFPTQVRIQFQGEPEIAALRSKYAVEDLTSMATLLTLNVLVEAGVKGQMDKMDVSKLVQALEGLAVFRSPLFHENKSALMTFWPRNKIKNSEKNSGAKQATVQTISWETYSENVEKGGTSFIPYAMLKKAVDDCGEKCPRGKAAVQEFQKNKQCLVVFNESLSDFAKRHVFPPDLTSSYANLALGATLKSAGDSYASAYEVWKSSSDNFTTLTQHVLQSAYKPASPKASENVIDSRSYYVIEDFLVNRERGLLQKDAFVMNWITQPSTDGLLRYENKTLPVYNVLDPFGTATFLNAVTSAVLQGLIPPDDSLHQLMKSNLDLMDWIVSNNHNDDLDLQMTPHPSPCLFYWMMSKTMFDLDNARVQNLTTFKPLEPLYASWNTTVRGHVTGAVLKMIQDGGLDEKGVPLMYVNNVVGFADVNEKGEAVPSGCARLFATATALNALLAAWTLYGKDNKLLFQSDTPDDVILACKGLVNYVNLKCVSEETSLMNVIYSTVHKHCESIPYCYPSNSVLTQDGKNFTGSQPTPDVVFGMRSEVLSADDYQKMLSQSRYGCKVPDRVPSMNETSAIFFFWSSPAYTQAMSLLALAQMKNLEEKAESSKH